LIAVETAFTSLPKRPLELTLQLPDVNMWTLGRRAYKPFFQSFFQR